MVLDACSTTRHWLSDCASAWLAYWFLLPQASLLPTLPVWLWTLTHLTLPQNGSTTTHPLSQSQYCPAYFIAFFFFFLLSCSIAVSVFMVLHLEGVVFRNKPALRISSLSWKAVGLFHHGCSALFNEAMSFISFSVCSRFSSLVFSFICVCCTPPVFGVNMHCMLFL